MLFGTPTSVDLAHFLYVVVVVVHVSLLFSSTHSSYSMGGLLSNQSVLPTLILFSSDSGSLIGRTFLSSSTPPPSYDLSAAGKLDS